MNRRLLSLLIFSTFAASGAWASEGVSAVIQLQSTGSSKDVLQAFVETSKMTFDPTADDIQKLEDAGVPASVIVAMIEHNSGGSAVAEATPVPAALQVADAGSAYAPAEGDLNVSTFYETLSSDGQWTNDPEFGYVWSPSVEATNPDWRPYVNDGHWVNTDQGWYWESNYNWGWAAFHYGRWNYNERNRWVWVPDNVWGPAWVDWRYSDSHYGWAPLPPGSRFDSGVGFSYRDKHLGFNSGFGLSEDRYAFVPANAFLSVNIGTVVERRDRNREFFGSTREVNNSYSYTDNRVVNTGVPLRDVEARTGHKVEQVRLGDSRVAAGQRIGREQREGNTLNVYRPKLASSAPLDPQAAIKRRDAAHPEAARANLRGAETARPNAPNHAVADLAAERKVAEERARQNHAAAATNENDAKKRLQDLKTQRQTHAAEERSTRKPEVAARTPEPAAPPATVREPVRTAPQTPAANRETERPLHEPARATPAEPAHAAPRQPEPARETPKVQAENRAAVREQAAETREAQRAESHPAVPRAEAPRAEPRAETPHAAAPPAARGDPERDKK